MQMDPEGLVSHEDEPVDARSEPGRRTHGQGSEKEDRHFVTALARGLDVLRCFKSGEERLGNQEIAERCELPKSTVTRLTYTLTKLGFLHHVAESGRYRLGLATLALGGATLSRLDVKEVSRPLMQDLADATHTLVSLGIRDETSMLYIESCRDQSLVTLRLGIGSRIPIATTAMGHAYLAGVAPNVRRDLEQRIQLMDPAAWPRVEEGIRQALDSFGAMGCCGVFGDWRKEIHAIAVPISVGQGLPIVVLNAAAPAGSASGETFMREFRPLLLEAARQIELRLRGRW